MSNICQVCRILAEFNLNFADFFYTAPGGGPGGGDWEPTRPQAVFLRRLAPRRRFYTPPGEPTAGDALKGRPHHLVSFDRVLLWLVLYI